MDNGLTVFLNQVVKKVVNLSPSLSVNDRAFQRCPFITQSWYYYRLLVEYARLLSVPVYHRNPSIVKLYTLLDKKLNTTGEYGENF